MAINGKTITPTKRARLTIPAMLDPAGRLAAWESARGAISKARGRKLLRELRVTRKTWDRTNG